MKKVSISVIAVIASLCLGNVEGMNPNEGRGGTNRGGPRVNVTPEEFASIFGAFAGSYTQQTQARSKGESKENKNEIKTNWGVKAQGIWQHAAGVYYFGRGVISFVKSLFPSSFYSIAALSGFWGVGLYNALLYKFNPMLSFLLSGSFVNSVNIWANGASAQDKFSAFLSAASDRLLRGEGHFRSMQMHCNNLITRSINRLYAFCSEMGTKKGWSSYLDKKRSELDHKRNEVSELERSLLKEEGDLYEKSDELGLRRKKLCDRKADLSKKITKLGKRGVDVTNRLAGLYENEAKLAEVEDWLQSVDQGSSVVDSSGYESDATVVDEATKNIVSLDEIQAVKEGDATKNIVSLDEIQAVKEGIAIFEEEVALSKEESELIKKEIKLDEAEDMLAKSKSKLRRAWWNLQFQRSLSRVYSAVSWTGSFAKNALADFVDGSGIIANGLCGTAYFIGSAAAYGVGVPATAIAIMPGFWSPMINGALKSFGVGGLKSFLITGGVVTISNFFADGHSAWKGLWMHLNGGIEEALRSFGAGVSSFDEVYFLREAAAEYSNRKFR